jgi:mRNA interferase MazF
MASTKPSSIQRGQIWDVKFDPQVGDEIGKIRPAVVMNIPSAGRLALHIVVPITTGKPSFAQLFWMLPLKATARTGLDHDSFADAFQVKSVSVARFIKQRGTLSQAEIDELAAIIAFCVGFIPPSSP